MSLIGTLRTSVSGMNAQSNRISTVAENIQNASTTGYKRTSVEFSSLLLESYDTGNYNSGAVETTVRRSIGSGGPITATTSGTDLAIQGDGFFVVRDANDATFLTRAGNFVVDGTSGNLVNAGGFTLMGYELGANGQDPSLNSVDNMVPVNLSSFGAKAQPTTTAAIAGNLPYETQTKPAGATYDKKTSMVVYDKVGQKRTLDIELTQTSNTGWTMRVSEPPAAGTLLTQNLTFANGKLTTTPATANFTLAGANGGPIALDMSGLTALAGGYSLKGGADGAAPAAVTGSAFGADGTVYALYADGSRAAAFKVPLADVRSPDNLVPRAGNVFATSPDSGAIEVGAANAGGRGALKAGALEQSNVDVSNELTSMIESQTVYTANSKVFQTGNELLETLMNLKR